MSPHSRCRYRIQAILIILVSLTPLAGCTADRTDDTSPIVLGYSQLGDESTWRTRNSRSIIEAAEAAGIRIMFENAMQDPENQIMAIRSFIAYKVDVIAFSPLVERGWDTVLGEAKAAGIPVIIVDRMIDTEDDSLYTTAFISDFYREGRRAGDFLVERYQQSDAPVRIVELGGTLDSTPAIGRFQGFRDVISSDPKFEVIFSEDGDFMLSKGREIMQRVLALYDTEDIDVLYSHNDDMTFGAIEVLQEAGIEAGRDIVIISVDATQRIIDYLRDGTVNYVIECNPDIGPQVMEIARRIVSGQEVPKHNFIEATVFDRNSDFDAIADRGY
ncbi:MAG: ABC transporter substrate-binding protein [Spirochaeta sp.]